MVKLTLKHLKLCGVIQKETETCIRTPEPSEACELASMYILADWFCWASLNHLVSQERCVNLSTYLSTIPSVGEKFIIVPIQ